MKLFKNLSVPEIDALLKLPVYVSILAANGDGSLDQAEKMSAVHIAHIKTFSCDRILVEFFNEVNKVFLLNLEEVDQKLPKDKEGREIAIRIELQHLEKVVQRLGKRYASAMHRGMKAFTEHVSRAHHNVIVDFLIPVAIPGLTESH